MSAINTQIGETRPANTPVVVQWIEMEAEDGESQWEREEERKEETNGESETVRLAIINHIRCWRRPCILATRQPPHPPIPCLPSLCLPLTAWSLLFPILHWAMPQKPTTVCGLCLQRAD